MRTFIEDNLKEIDTMKKTEKKSNNKNAEVKKTKNKIDSKKINNKERAKYDDMRQIDWYPIDPYCD